MSSWTPGPLVMRRRLGLELRRLREAAGLKLEDVARELHVSQSKISRLETGKGIPQHRDVRDILATLGVPDGDDRTRLLEWSRTGRAKRWWDAYTDVLSSGFDVYVELEWDAATLHAYESHLVHGLLQTPDYARSILASVWPDADDRRLSRLLEVRLRRQEVLDEVHGLRATFLLDQSTLLRRVGSTAIMAAQIRHLHDLVERGIDIRILPFSKGPVAPNLGSFATLYFPDAEWGVVHEERPGSTAVDDDPAVCARHEAVFARIAGAALGPGENSAMLRET